MNKFFKNFIWGAVVGLAVFGFALGASAQAGPLQVSFNPDPLFSEGNFLPEDTAEGTVTVTNQSGSPQTILTETINEFDTDGLGEHLKIEIKEGASVVYADKLSEFFADGEVSLGAIATGTNRTFTYEVSFDNISDKFYYYKTLGFDICVGFEGGNTTCGGGVIDDEDDDGNDNPPGGGGGGGGGTTTLIVFNENATPGANPSPSIPTFATPGGEANTGKALISWTSNLPASSQVIYGKKALGPYVLDINNPPGYGYPYYTDVDLTTLLNHNMFLTGLEVCEPYVYRVVSGNPLTIGFEYEFIPTDGINVCFGQGGEEGELPDGEVLGVATSANEEMGGVAGREEGGVLPWIREVLGAESEKGTEAGNLSASVILSDFKISDLWSRCVLIFWIIVLVSYLIWRIFFLPRYQKKKLPIEVIRNLFASYFGTSHAIAIAILLIWPYFCPIPYVAIVALVSYFVYLYRKIRYGEIRGS